VSNFYDGKSDEEVARGSHPGGYKENAGLSDAEMAPLIKRFEAAHETQGKLDFIAQARHSFRLLSEAGFNCSGMNVIREGFTILMIVDAIECDPIVEERTKDGNTLNTVAKMTSSEKAALRTRVGEVTHWVSPTQYSILNQRS
jgi:hypothetical protein